MVTTCLGLPGIVDTHWLIPGSWYCTLIFSIGSVALAFQQKGALSGVALGMAIRRRSSLLPQGGVARPSEPDEAATLALTTQPSFQRFQSYDIVAWQAPVQLLTYALGFFFFGLLGFLGQPVVAGPWGPRSKVCSSPGRVGTRLIGRGSRHCLLSGFRSCRWGCISSRRGGCRSTLDVSRRGAVLDFFSFCMGGCGCLFSIQNQKVFLFVYMGVSGC